MFRIPYLDGIFFTVIGFAILGIWKFIEILIWIGGKLWQ